MRRKLFLILSMAIVLVLCVGVAPVLSQGQVAYAYTADAATYYNGITASSGQALLGQLHDLITTTHQYYTSYNDCKDPAKIKQSDAGSSSSYVTDFYTQKDISATWGSGSAGTWNREHCWCQSLSGGLWGTSGGGSDLHHLRPVETRLNGTRGNKLYGEVSGGSPAYAEDTNDNPTTDIGGYTSGNVFMPLDSVKGDVARIVLYVYTHYNSYNNVGGTTNGNGGASFGSLPITNVISASNEQAAFDLLAKWNKNDPVDQSEINRNNYVATLQGNRNPYIDHPEYVDAIWGSTPVGPVELTSISLSPATASVAVGANVTLNVVKVPANAAATITWSSSNPSVATVSGGVVTGVSAGTTTITATPAEEGVSAATATVTVKQMTGISVTGAPAKTAYTEGQAFDPAGLTVRANFSDSSFADLSLSDCQWLDGVTRAATLSKGTTSVICKYGSFEQTVSGITVTEASQGGNATNCVSTFKSAQLEINETNSLNYSAGYSANGFDSNRGAQFLMNSGAVTITSTSSANNITSVKVTVASNNDSGMSVAVNVGSTAFTCTTSSDVNKSNSGSNTITLEFTSSVPVTGAVAVTLTPKANKNSMYIKAIEVSGGGTVTPGPDPTDSVRLNKSVLTLAVGGSETLAATASGTVTWTSSAPSVATVSASGTVQAVAAGSATITATCGTATATCAVTVTSGSTPTPSGKDAYLASVVTSPAVGTAYKWALWQNQQSQIYYFAGATESASVTYRLATTTNVSQATDVMLESVSGGGYHLYFMNGGAKTYIRVFERTTSSGASGSLELTTSAPTTAAVYDNGILKYTYGSNTYYVGSYNNYYSFSVSNVTRITGTNASALDVTQYPARLVSTEQPAPVEGLTLNKTNANLVVGGNETLVATPTGGLTGTVVWTSSNTAVATVVNGVVTAVAEGSATITATIGEISATCVVSVENTLTMSTETVVLKTGETHTAVAQASSVVTWATSNTAVATVSASGVVTAVAEGSATITAICGSKSVSFVVVVSDEDIPEPQTESVEITFASGFQAQANYKVHDWTQGALIGKAFCYTAENKLQFKATSGGYFLNTVATTGGILSVKLELGSKGTITDWKLLTANTAFAADNKGALPTGGTEQTNVTVEGSTAIWTLNGTHTYFTLNVAGALSIVSKITVTYNKTAIVIPDPTDSVTLDKQTLALEGVGATGKIEAVATGTPVWSTSDSSVATVAQDGTVTAVGRGTATITATCGAATATCAVTVNVPYSITLDKTTLALKVGEFETLVATANGEVTFSTEQTDVVSVDNNGKVTALSAGVATVTATCGTATATCTVTVSERDITDSVTLDKTTATAAVGATVTLTPTASGDVTWSTSDASVATVANGVVTGVSAGTATITATCGTATATCTVTVTAEPNPDDSVTLDKTTLTVEVQHSAKLEATASGAVVWSSSDTQIADVDNQGNVYGIAAGTATITATCGTATATCTVTVTAEPNPDDSVTLDQSELTLTKGQSASLVAVASGAVTWSSSDTAVVQVNAKGMVVAVGVGTATVTATCGTATAICTVTVSEKADESEKIAAFIAAVDEIGSDSTEENFNKIKHALTLYNGLSDAGKYEVSGKYAYLSGVIRAYNGSKEDINNAMLYQGIYYALDGVASVAAALAVAIILKRFV